MKKLSRKIGAQRLIKVGIALVLIAGLSLSSSVVLAQNPDFDSSYKTGPAQANMGDIITYTIVVVNTGTLAQNVTLSDNLLVGGTYVPGTCTYDRGAGPQPCVAPLGQMWTEDLATGDSITTNFQVQVTAGTMQWPLTNCFVLNWNNQEWSNEDWCVTTLVNPQPTPTPTSPPPPPPPPSPPAPTETPTPMVWLPVSGNSQDGSVDVLAWPALALIVLGGALALLRLRLNSRKETIEEREGIG